MPTSQKTRREVREAISETKRNGKVSEKLLLAF